MSCLDSYLLFLIFKTFSHKIDVREVWAPTLIHLIGRMIFFLPVKNHNTGFVVSSCVVLH